MTQAEHETGHQVRDDATADDATADDATARAAGWRGEDAARPQDVHDVMPGPEVAPGPLPHYGTDGPVIDGTGLIEDSGRDEGPAVPGHPDDEFAGGVPSSAAADPQPVRHEPAGDDVVEAQPDPLGARERESVTAAWHEIQARFVDEPRTALEDADALVDDVLQRVTRSLGREREQLAQAWSGAGGTSTEDLRQGLRRYHALFDRLLSA